MHKKQVPSSKKTKLSPTQQAILKERLKGEFSESTENTNKSQNLGDLPPIVPDKEHRYESFPLNELQQAYWIGRNNAIEMGNVACHVYLEIDVLELDLKRLNWAWQTLLERHDMLRAIILPDGQQQILEKVFDYQIEVCDLRGKLPHIVTSELEATRDRLSHQVLSLDNWPLFEICASRLDEQRTRLHFSVDTIVADAWSLRLLIQELDTLYQNPTKSLPPLDLSFRDYVLADTSLQQTEIYQNSLKYWQDRLPELSPAPQLPLAKSPSSLTHPRFVRHQGKLDADTWIRLKTLATQKGLTPSGILLAVYAEVLAFWSNTTRLTLNVPYFNRFARHPQVNQLVGAFPSFILLEVIIPEETSFEVRAQQIQQQIWQDIAHSHVSGVRILRELAQSKGEVPRAAMPIVFTSTLSYSQIGQEISSQSHLGEIAYSITQTPQVWLDLQVSEEDKTLLFDWDVVEELFPVGLIEEIFDTFVRRLQTLAHEPDSWQQNWRETVQQLMPPSQIEQRKVINATEAPISPELLHTLFASQVAAQPDHKAVISSSCTLTYEELYCRANQVAHRLTNQGISPNQLIAVVMEKGWEQVVAVLGILGAGGAYLPIDPSLPKERLQYLLNNGQVKWVLTQPWLNDRLGWCEDVQKLCVGTKELETENDLPLEPQQQPEDLAYVIYTSGSTGFPKGVMISHRSAVNAILCTNQRFNINNQDRVLALTALNHDMSVYDIFGVLAAGGTLVMPDAKDTRNPAQWAELIRKEKITVWNSVPAMMEMLLEYVAGRAELLSSSLRLVFLGGDWISLTLPEKIKALVNNVNLVSVGGPTETTLWNIWYPITTVDQTWNSIPYGQPIANTRYYVLNSTLENCPVWVPGEIYCAGLGLAKGYWQDPEKTQAKFIIHPRTEERLYRTGDFGRYLPDGNIEFLGRLDSQVKIRGYRIEPREIEVALTKHPEVKAAVVIASTEQNNKRLLAYIVPREQTTPESIVPTQNLVEAIDPSQIEGALFDPVDRIEFKLKQLALRHSEPEQPCIQLAKPELDEDLTQAYLKRQSYREFLEDSIPFAQFSHFLSCLLQIEFDQLPIPKYRYPSGGGLYPVQVYFYFKPGRVEGIAGGIYYYHPVNHQLLLVNPIDELESSIYPGINQPIFAQSAFSLFLIGEMKAISPMYGQWAKELCLIEAGYMGQLLMESATDDEIGLCPVGFLKFEALQNVFGLEPSQVLLHSFLGGKIDPAQTQQWLQSNTNFGSKSLTLELRQFLQQQLPEYMVPSNYVLLNSLPLSANGKIDRKALPDPDVDSSNLTTPFVAPRTPLEEQLASIWAHLLGVEQIGIHDNFFQLGGNSLLATQLVSRIRENFQLDLPLRHFFETPTLGSIAEYIEMVRWAAQDVQDSDMSGEKIRF